MLAQAIAMQADLHQRSLTRLLMGKSLLVLCAMHNREAVSIPKPACENGLTPRVCGIAHTIHIIEIARTQNIIIIPKSQSCKLINKPS